MIAGMHSPWDPNAGKAEGVHLFSGRQDEGELLGQILERSTSAPPRALEGNVDHGGSGYEHDERESYLFGGARRGPATSRLFDTSGRDTAPVSSTVGGSFFPEHEENGGRSSVPGLYSSSGYEEPLFGTNEREDDRRAFLFEREELVRSHSAAPALIRGGSLGAAPPGLGRSRRSAESLLLHTNDSAPLTYELQRPASTGVIGDHAVSEQTASSAVLSSLGLELEGGGAVRPAPKTLMDLIQEDFPSSPSMYKAEHPDASYDAYPPDYVNRPRSSTPPSQYGRVEGGHRGYRAEQPERVPYSPQESLGGITHSMDRLRVTQGDNYPREALQQTGVQYAPRPQRVEQLSREYMQEPASPRSMYAPAGRGPTQHQPGPYYADSQPVYYSDRQPRNVAVPQPVQAQILPSGQAVYVNAPPAYGYGTPQYHPPVASPQHQQQQHHHVVHQVTHPTTEYISVVPVQTGGPITSVSSQGTYAYWQQPDVPQPSVAQPTVSYVATHAGAAPVATMSRTPHSPVDPALGGGRRQKTAQGRSPSEKGGKRRGRRGDGKHASGGSHASPLLEEFRASKNHDWTIVDIKGHLVEFCQDQNGSRFIQQRLEIGDLNEKRIVITEILPDVESLRNDVFGNYVVQKLLEFGTPEMKADLRETLKGEMLALSLQMYGCRVVQKALETLDDEDVPRLLVEFHHNVLSCIQDQNGNHVIQKCIEVMSTRAKTALAHGDEAKAQYFSEQIDFIINDVLNNVASLSCHPYGCRVLQRILEHCIEPKKSRTLDEIRKCHRPLLDDQYGNYVIQHVLQYGRDPDRDSILQIVVESGLLKLSKQKFASNVVEKLLKYGNNDQRRAVVREMLKTVDEHTGAPLSGDSGGSSVVLLMVRDAYANYVVQTTLDVVPEGEEKRMLLEELNSHSAQLRNYTFAKHIVTKLGA